MEGEFVEEAGAAFAGLGVGVGGEGVDGGVVGEGEDEGGGAGIFGEEGGAEGRGGGVEDVGEGFAVFEEELGLFFVLGGDPGVEVVIGGGVAADEGVGGGPGHADLAGFFHDFDLGGVLDPALLVGEEEGGGGGGGFGGGDDVVHGGGEDKNSVLDEVDLFFDFLEGFRGEGGGGVGGRETEEVFFNFVEVFFHEEFAGFELEGFGMVIGGGEFVDDGGDIGELVEVEVVVGVEEGEEGLPGEGDGGVDVALSGGGVFDDLEVGGLGMEDWGVGVLGWDYLGVGDLRFDDGMRFDDLSFEDWVDVLEGVLVEREVHGCGGVDVVGWLIIGCR